MKYQTLEHGDGDPLILLHGMMGEPVNWANTFAYLPDGCRAIALRFPFFDDGDRINSVSAAKEYLEGFLDERGIGSAVYCGNSFGGHVALDMALRSPHRVNGIVLSGSSGLFERGFQVIPGSRPPRSWFKKTMAEIFYDDQTHCTEELVDKVRDVLTPRNNIRTLLQIAKSAKRDNMSDRLHTITCPVLLIWGRQDEITPPSVAEEFHQGLPNSTLEWLDECGHTAMMEHPEQFACILGRWWGDCIGATFSTASGGVQ